VLALCSTALRMAKTPGMHDVCEFSSLYSCAQAADFWQGSACQGLAPRTHGVCIVGRPEHLHDWA
jgi:hypothetical protein